MIFDVQFVQKHLSTFVSGLRERGHLETDTKLLRITSLMPI